MAEPENEAVKEEEAKSESFNSFDEYLSKADPKIVELYNGHVSGLKTALERERDDRRKLSEQVKSLLPKAEEGSELQGKLAETVKLLEQTEQRFVEEQRRANFAEQAIRPEVGCTNVKAAYALAVSENLFTKDGSPAWTELKRLAPELFKSGMNSKTNAGNSKSVITSDINSAIRRAAGLGG